MEEDFLSPEEYNALLREQLRGGGAGAATAEAPVTPPTPSPTRSFFDRLIHGAEGKSRVVEMGRSAVRGVAKAFDEAEQTVSDLTGLEIDRISTEAVDEKLGARSDDPIAAFTESVTQFATGFVGTGKLRIGGTALSAMRGAAGVAAAAGRGAVADFSVFDPYEASLSELMAKAPVRGVSDLGKILTVTEDDSPIVARFKRAQEGILSGAVVDGLVATARIVRSGRVLRSSQATPEAKEAAAQVIEREEKVLDEVGQGTYKPEGEPLSVRLQEDGTFKIEGEQAADAPSPTFTSRSEAESTVAVLNQGLKAREQAARPVSEEDVGAVIQTFKELRGRSRDEILTEMEEVNHFNPSYMDAPEKSLEAIHSLSLRFKDVIDEAQHHPEGVSVEETIRLAREGIGSLTEYEAPKAISEVLGETVGKSVWTLMGDATLKKVALKVGQMSDMLDARPHDEVLHEEARLAIENMLELQVRLAGSNSEIGRTLRMLQERDHPGLKDVEFATEGKPKPEPKPNQGGKRSSGSGRKPKEAKPEEPTQYTAGMAHHQIATIARMIKLGGGQPANMLGVARGARVLQHTGKGSKALEVFTNFLLSGPQTPLTAIGSGTAVSIFEPVSRMVAGFTNGNPAMTREGWDILAGHAMYLKDNLVSAAAALKAGHSIVNPQPSHAAIGGLTGEIIRMPGRVLMGIDEFIRVSNYRSYVRARSMRIAREQGLSGAALDRRVAEDLAAAFDPDTGIAVIKEAADYADTPTFQTQLDPKGFGEGLRRFTNEHIAAKFVAPFVRASVNLFDYAWTMTPGINQANKTYKRVMAEGMAEGASRSAQEAAQALQARAMLGGTIYGFAFYQAMAGNLTGEGPVDPELRALWLKDNQPYSIKIGNKWISYRRMDPLGAPLGLVADIVRGGQETEWQDTSIEELGIAVVSSLVANLANKTYMQGITDFAAAWGRGDENAAGRWLRNFAAAFTVPNALNQLNPDDLYREADTFKEAIFARIPGLSKTLTPRYNAFGEPIMKAPGYWNRSVNILRAKEATYSPVEQAMLTIEQGFPPIPRTTEDGIDLTEKRWDAEGNKSPYVRWMELISKPEYGPSLREDLEALVTSPEWQQMSAGSEQWKGGERYLRALGVKQRHQQRAWQAVLTDPAYESLTTEIQMLRRMEGASIRGGDAGVAEVQQLFEAVR